MMRQGEASVSSDTTNPIHTKDASPVHVQGVKRSYDQHQNNLKSKKHQQERQDLALLASDNPIPYYDAFHRDPPTRKIKKIHVYDFDNTLFRSPGPNPALFQDGTLGLLTSSEHLSCGGWWKEPLVLRNLGEGWMKETERQWSGFWNEDIVELLKMSIEEDDTLAIVMTGRRKTLFAELIKEMLESRDLFQDIDGFMLRQGEFTNTIEYKTQVLVDLLNHFTEATEVVLYDDRMSQLNGFEKCLNEYTDAVRPLLISNMVPVFTDPVFLDPKAERKLVEEMLERHNKAVQHGNAHGSKLAKCALRKSNLYTSYLVDYDSRANLISFLTNEFPDIFTEEVFKGFKFQVDHIPILRGLMSRTSQTEMKDKPRDIDWIPSEIGVSETHIAIRVKPVTPESITKTLQDPPLLPIAAKGKNSSRPPEEYASIVNWRPIETPITFNSRLSNIISFKIIHDGGPLKGMRKKKALDTNQQAELP